MGICFHKRQRPNHMTSKKNTTTKQTKTKNKDKKTPTNQPNEKQNKTNKQKIKTKENEKTLIFKRCFHLGTSAWSESWSPADKLLELMKVAMLGKKKDPIPTPQKKKERKKGIDLLFGIKPQPKEKKTPPPKKTDVENLFSH